MDGLLESVSGLLAVLDENRQIVALNHSFLKMLSIDDPGKILGLRPGEAINCVHSDESPHGCGTTKYCSSCGAAIAIVSSLGQNEPIERICALTAKHNGSTVDIALLVRSQPIRINGKRFLLLFLQDITRQQQRAALERTFFHDINNILTTLMWASDQLIDDSDDPELARTIQLSSRRLVREVAIQKCLFQQDESDYQLLENEISVEQVINDLQAMIINHPAAHGKRLQLPSKLPHLKFKTDTTLLLRVLGNMAINAFEATDENGEVKMWLKKNKEGLTFYAWNDKSIPDDIALRVFQRNFSTKEGEGRGLGTFSMKLFGEKYLGGQVGFISSEKEGTVFSFTLKQ